MTGPNTPEPAFDRLLQVAVEVFAEFGFRDATVREICTRANVNVASVSYYFRSKDALYVQALNFAFKEANRRYPQEHLLDQSLSPEQRFTGFVVNFIKKLLDDSNLGFFNKLIAREIYEPTKALDDILATAIVPQFGYLEAIIRQLLSPQVDNQTVQRCMLSVFGQCLTFKHSRSIVERLFPELIADPIAIQATAQHIADFSLYAFAQFKASNPTLPDLQQ
ncbi:MAG: CerR family C-terminal domain-containing protein [Methylococcales bacterium]